MVLIKFRKVIMPATLDADQRNFMRIYLLQSFTIPDRDQPIFSAVNNIGMTIYMTNPPVGS